MAVDGVAGANGERLSLFGEEDSVRCESGIISIVTKLTDGEQRVVGHCWENMGAPSNGGKWRQDAVVG